MNRREYAGNMDIGEILFPMPCRCQIMPEGSHIYERYGMVMDGREKDDVAMI